MKYLSGSLSYNNTWLSVRLPDLLEGLDGTLTTLLDDNIQVWAMKSQVEHTQVHTLLDKLEAASDKPVPAVLRATTSLKSPTLYIFTSGTTGGCKVYGLLKKKIGHMYVETSFLVQHGSVGVTLENEVHSFI